MSKRALLWRFVREQVALPGTWWTALVVGTLINAYGHLLVPWLSGIPRPLRHFFGELDAKPLLIGSSLLLGYVFPLLVGIYASVATRWRRRHLENDWPSQPEPGSP